MTLSEQVKIGPFGFERCVDVFSYFSLMFYYFIFYPDSSLKIAYDVYV